VGPSVAEGLRAGGVCAPVGCARRWGVRAGGSGHRSTCAPTGWIAVPGLSAGFPSHYLQ